MTTKKSVLLQKRITVWQKKLQGLKHKKNGKRKSLLTPMGKATAAAVVLCALILLGVALRDHADPNRSQDRRSIDTVCYLAAKYESSGHAESVGEDGIISYRAYGEYQFFYAYELVPFVNWCYKKDPQFYRAFAGYLEMSTEEIPSEEFRDVWKQLADKDYRTFEEDQQEYVVETTLKEACETLTEAYGYDFVHAQEAIQACVLSIANREGKYLENLSPMFDGTTADSSEEAIILHAYAQMQRSRPEEQRWSIEMKDCLALLNGTLDIYAVSENDAGGIDWSWK